MGLFVTHYLLLTALVALVIGHLWMMVTGRAT
jgi:hypothetical protein